MYKEQTLMKIDKICVNTTVWENDEYPKELTFDWVEYSPDYWYSDTEVSINITKEDAIKLVGVLKDTFDI